jgi:hypothetical protein
MSPNRGRKLNRIGHDVFDHNKLINTAVNVHRSKLKYIYAIYFFHVYASKLKISI